MSADYELPSGGWNYRLFHRQVSDGIGDIVDEFSIREAFYDDQNGAVVAWSEHISAPMGESVADVLSDLEMMRCAFDKPTVEITSDGNSLARNSDPE